MRRSPISERSVGTDRQHALSEEEMMLEQENENYYRVAATQVGYGNSQFTVNKKGLIISNSLVKEAKQIFVPLYLLQNILHIYYYPPILAPETLTSTVTSDHYYCSLPPVRWNSSQWISPVPCQKRHKVISTFWRQSVDTSTSREQSTRLRRTQRIQRTCPLIIR